MTTPSQTQPVKARRGVRCGWCGAGDHENCILAVEITDGPAKLRVHYPWRCPCETCKELAKVDPEKWANRTRCTRCNRRGVEINEMWHCINEIDCTEYRAKKRAADPAMRQLDQIRAELNRGDDPMAPTPAKRTAKTTKTGSCLCCGEPTRGGKFLPGHDSRYVSTQAQEYVKLEEEERRTKVYDEMEALGAALHAKFVKRVEALRAKASDGVQG